MLNENAASDMAASETVTEVDDAFEVADRVMLFLREQSVAPCPRTFELMFAYFLGKDPTLKEAVDSLLRTRILIRLKNWSICTTRFSVLRCR